MIPDRIVQEMHDDLLAAMRARCPRRRTRWREHEILTFAVVHPDNVSLEWHVAVPFSDLRAEATWFLHTFGYPRPCESNGILIICPVQ